MTTHDQLDGDDLAVLRGLVLAWLQATDAEGLAELDDDEAAVDALLSLRDKNLVRFEMRPAETPDSFFFSVVVPPEVQAALAAQSGRLQ